MQFWHSIYIFFKYTTEINQLKKFLKSLVILVSKIMIFVCFYRFLVMKMTFFKSSFLVQVHQKIDLSSVQVHMVKIELSSVQKFTFWWTLNWTKKVQFNNTLKIGDIWNWVWFRNTSDHRLRITMSDNLLADKYKSIR